MMKITIVRAENFALALAKIKREFGSEAVIMETRKVRKPGIKGWLQDREVEVKVGIPPLANKPGSELEQFRELVKKIGMEIRSDKNRASHGYWLQRLAAVGITGAIAENVACKAANVEWNPEVAASILSEFFVTETDQARVQVFLGPTGAGKTATLAKLAGRYAKLRRKVAIISLDAKRLGTLEQLRTYGKMMGAQVAVVDSPAEFSLALARFSAHDRILVDTGGCAAGNMLGLAAIRLYLGTGKEVHRTLVVSATTKPEDLQVALEGFGSLGLDSMIITKLDETTSPGALAEFCSTSGLPVSHVGTGQNIPSDLVAVDRLKLARLLLAIDREGVLPDYARRGTIGDGAASN